MIFDVVVICGGNSPERSVSLKSGFAVAQALESLSYNVALLDPALGKHGLFPWPLDCQFLQNTPISSDFESHFEALVCLKTSERFNKKKSVIFVALHGIWGEDGKAQALFETLGWRFTGSNSWASALAMNKSATKALLKSCDIPIPFGMEIDRAQFRQIVKAKRSWLLDLKTHFAKFAKANWLIVKPNIGGSSIATSRVEKTDEKAIFNALETSLSQSQSALIEIFIEGREFTASVLDDRVLPLVEIKTPFQFSSYEGKYKSSTTEYQCPVTLCKADEVMIKETALLAHRVLGAGAFSRSDFRYSSDRQLHFLELNTLPGLTSRSLFPMAAQKCGLPFERLCQKLLNSARKWELSP